jgi:hypothetical protein
LHVGFETNIVSGQGGDALVNFGEEGAAIIGVCD